MVYWWPVTITLNLDVPGSMSQIYMVVIELQGFD